MSKRKEVRNEAFSTFYGTKQAAMLESTDDIKILGGSKGGGIISTYLESKVNTLRIMAGEISDIVYVNEDKFLRMFCCNTATDLTKLSFDENKVSFTYIVYDGSHIGDSISWEEFKKFLKIVEER